MFVGNGNASNGPSYTPLPGIGVSDLWQEGGGFLVIDHRGWPVMYPESSLEAYRTSVAAGAQVVEVDVYQLKDGTLGCMHDPTVNRTTTTTGNVRDFTAAGWSRLAINGSGICGGGWDDCQVPTLDTILREFGNRTPIVLENKETSVSCANSILRALKRHQIRPEMVFINCFGVPGLIPFVGAGYTTCLNVGLYSGVNPTIAQIKGYGFDWLGVQYGTDVAQMDEVRASGIKVVPWTISMMSELATLKGHCDAVYSDDGSYHRGSARSTTDPFMNQTWWPGQIKANSQGDGGGRGYFVAPNQWGYNMSGFNIWAGAAQGWANPIGAVATLPSITLTFSIKHIAALTEDRFGWVALMQSDVGLATDGPPLTKDGYSFICRKNGQLNIYRFTSGVEASTLIATGSSAAIANGEVATYRVVVTPTQLTLGRLNDVTSIDAAVADSTHRGSFLHAGVKGIHGLFSSVSISVP